MSRVIISHVHSRIQWDMTDRCGASVPIGYLFNTGTSFATTVIGIHERELRYLIQTSEEEHVVKHFQVCLDSLIVRRKTCTEISKLCWLKSVHGSLLPRTRVSLAEIGDECACPCCKIYWIVGILLYWGFFRIACQLGAVDLFIVKVRHDAMTCVCCSDVM